MIEEEIKKCLKCEKPDCDNCMDRSEEYYSNKYLWKGMHYSISELSRMRGLKIASMKYRIETGGIDFAMSDYRSYKKYKIDVLGMKEGE